jgi:hypothetical protein
LGETYFALMDKISVSIKPFNLKVGNVQYNYIVNCRKGKLVGNKAPKKAVWSTQWN